MKASDDRQNRQNARFLQAHTQEEEGARQETAGDIGSADLLDKEDALPTDGVTTPQDEEPPTDDSGRGPNKTKKMKLEKSTEVLRGRTKNRTRVSQPNKDKV